MKRTSSTLSVSAPPKKKQYRKSRTGTTYGRTSIREVKSYDQPLVNGNLPAYNSPPVYGTVGAAFAGFTCLNAIGQGSAFYERVGSKIVIKTIQLNANVYCPATYSGVVRVALVYDRQSNGAAPAITDVFNSYTFSGTSGLIDGSGINMQNRSRFQVIRDQFFNLDAAQSLFHHIKWFCKGRWEVEYKSNTGAITDIATGSLLLFAWLGIPGGAGNPVLADVVARIRYYD